MSGVIHCLVNSISTGHRLLSYLFGWGRPLRIRRPTGGSGSLAVDVGLIPVSQQPGQGDCPLRAGVPVPANRRSQVALKHRLNTTAFHAMAVNSPAGLLLLFRIISLLG